MSESILITGMGICSPIGHSLEDVASALREGQSGIKEIQSFDSSPLKMRKAAEVQSIPCPSRFPKGLYRTWDRGTRMAMHAADSALKDASLRAKDLPLGRIGVCCGTSGSGQYQNARFRLDRSLHIDAKMVFYLSRNSPHYQSSQVAAQFGIQGPNLAIGAATAGSGIALMTALAWLRNHQVDAMLVGGSECFSLLNVMGFDQLGLSAEEVCTPFSGEPGMTFGEGAAYLVLERASDATQRGVSAHAVLAGAAVQSDAFDPILFDPSGDGQARTIKAALRDANCSAESIDWIKASGTGGRDQDLAESMAIRETFPNPPPVSSIEPYLGHANGAGPMIGIVAAVLCLKNGFVPSTLGCTNPRPGCDLDYVAEGTRILPSQRVLCHTAAFGGVNCSSIVENLPEVVHRDLDQVLRPKQPIPTMLVHTTTGQGESSRAREVVVSGVGLVTPLGCGNLDVFQTEFDTPQLENDERRFADCLRKDLPFGLVKNFSARKLCPTIALRGIEPLTKYAAAAASLALKQADVLQGKIAPERIGIATALTRSSGSVFTQLFKELQADSFRPLVGRLMLRNGRFMLASQISNWFGIKGFSSSISLGAGSGLHAVAAAYDQLLSNPNLDAMLVVAADELSPFVLDLFQHSGMLADSLEAWQPYSSRSSGMLPGEGAVAFVLEKPGTCEARGARRLAKLTSAHSNFEALPGADAYSYADMPAWEVESNEHMLTHCIERAYQDAQLLPEQIDVVLGNGCGIWKRDMKEIAAISQMLPNPPTYTSYNHQTGFCESTSCLINLAGAVYALQNGRTEQLSATSNLNGSPNWNLPPAHALRSALVVASSEQGHNAVSVLEPIK